jgi:hypothetical protein
MELLFGTQVRSGGRRIGYLAGLEVDAATRTVTKIIFSDDGKLGAHAHTRPLSAVRADRSGLSVEDTAASVTAGQPVLWSRSIRLVRDRREFAKLGGAVLGDGGSVQAVIGRQHWWTKRVRFAAAELDFTTPGEIRIGAARPVAA